MNITVKIDSVEITISEENHDSERTVSMKWKDQNKQVQETLQVMCEQAIKLREVSHES